MKHMLMVALILAASASAAGADSDSSYHCPGFRPAPPVSCKGPARCLCDSEGRCSWVFDCSGDER
jgi:hypothetical protein